MLNTILNIRDAIWMGMKEGINICACRASSFSFLANFQPSSFIVYFIAECRSLELPEADESAGCHDEIGHLCGSTFLNIAVGEKR